MRTLVEVFLKENYHLLRSKEARAFLKLAYKIGDVERYVTKKVTYLDYKFTVTDCLSFLWQVKEIFVDDSYHFATPNATPVIFDCGANIGTSCIYFKKLYPKAKITAFEADPSIARVLQQNLEFNNIKEVEVVAKAVWVDNDGIEIALEGADAASMYLGENKVAIPSVRLRDYLQQERHVDMLKIDIEGAEVDVLKDCADLLHKVSNIFIEYHSFGDQPQNLDVVLSILQQNNLRYFIKDARDRRSPLIHHKYRDNSPMDLQLNIYAYRSAV
jgi:FkbM family methyltransferase